VEDKFVRERGVARLWEVARFDFLLPCNYVLANECRGGHWFRYIVSIQVHVVDVWVSTVWACILIFVWLRGEIRVGEWCCEVMESCKVQFSTSSQPDKNLYVFVQSRCQLCQSSNIAPRYVCVYVCNGIDNNSTTCHGHVAHYSATSAVPNCHRNSLWAPTPSSPSFTTHQPHCSLSLSITERLSRV